MNGKPSGPGLRMRPVTWRGFDWIPVFWIPAYVWLAMKHVYGQGWLRTTIKWWTLGWLYFFVLSFGLLALTVATVVVT